MTQITAPITQFWYRMKEQNKDFLSESISQSICQLKHSKKILFFNLSMDGPFCFNFVLTDMIDKTLTFHLITNTSHLDHIQCCYNVIIPKVKCWQRGDLEFAILGFLQKRTWDPCPFRISSRPHLSAGMYMWKQA